MGGYCSGRVAQDTMKLAGFVFKGQGFFSASSIASVIGYQPFDGVLGLGWPSIAVGGVTPPIQNIMGQFDKKLFTVWLDRHVRPSHGIVGGLITYGAIDTYNCASQIDYVPLTNLSELKIFKENINMRNLV